MNAIAELLDFLKTIPGMGALMNVNNIFASWVFETVLPYIIMTTISTVPESQKGNTTAKTVSLFQLDIYTETFEAGVAISDLIVQNLDGKQEVNGSSFFLSDVRDFGEETTKKFRRSVDVYVEIQSS